jgi:ATP-dependent Clp protease ATP-binding subunit ClpA
MVLAITTPGESQNVIGGQNAVERRYTTVDLLEPSDAETLKILIKEKDQWERRYDRLIDVDVLKYMVMMRKIYNNPPQAMPASVLKGVERLFVWSTRPENKKAGDDSKMITEEDAYRFIIEDAQLPEIWKAKGKHPPLYNLAEEVKKRVVGNEKIIESISRSIKSGRLNGFRDVPAFVLMGPSRSGKDTIVNAFHEVLFGEEKGAIAFNAAGGKGVGLILDGSESQAPLLLSRLRSQRHAVIAINEAKDMQSSALESLKIFIESGMITPKEGKDLRQYPLGINPIFLMGQWGEEQFAGLSEEKIAERYDSLTEADLVRILERGKDVDGGKTGSLPYAMVQRFLERGGIFMLKPVPESQYKDVVRLILNKHILNPKRKTGVNVTIDDSLVEYIANLAIKTKRGVGGLLGITTDFTEIAVSEAFDEGLPMKDVNVSIKVDQDDILVIQTDDKGGELKTYRFKHSQLMRMQCSDALKPASS